MQSGIAGVVGNASLYGILTEALNYETIEEIYGVYNGFKGLQEGNFLDLAAVSQQSAKMLLHTAGFALKSEPTAFNVDTGNLQQMIQNLKSKEIHYICCICDPSILTQLQRLLEAAEGAQYDLRIVSIPLCNNNKLSVADHSLGYGSYLKCLNAQISEFDHWLDDSGARLGIFEVFGGSNGWVTAGVALNTVLAKWKQGTAAENPFLICLPEQPLNEALLMKLIQEKIQTCGHACIAVNQQLVNEQGEFLDVEPYGGSSAYYLSNLVQNNLGVVSQVHSCPLQMQALSAFISKQDQTEAIACGKAAVKQLIEENVNAKAAIVMRKEGDHYDFEVDFVEWKPLVSGLKFFPTDWTDNALWIQYAFIKYAFPLIQGEVPLSYDHGLVQLARL